MLMVTLLGKRVGFKLMEAKLNCEWAKKGAIKIFDVSREYYQVLFSSNEDYNHAIFDGSWMVAWWITIFWFKDGGRSSLQIQMLHENWQCGLEFLCFRQNYSAMNF